MNFDSNSDHVVDNEPPASILSIEEIRNEILNLTIFTSACFAVPAIIISLARTIDFGWQKIMYLHLVLSLIVFVTYAFRYRISYRFRASIIASICLIAATFGLLSWGLIGMGDMYFLLFIIFSGAFFSFRTGLFAILTAFLIMMSIGICVSLGKIKYNFDIEQYSSAISSWAMLIVGVSFFSALVMYSTNRIWKVFSFYIDSINQRALELSIKNKKIKEEVALREDIEERYNAIFKRSFDLIFIYDFEGNFIDANSAVLKLTGYGEEDIKNLKFDSFVGKYQAQYAIDRSKRIKENGRDNDLVTFKIKCRNGGYKIIEERGSLLYRDKKPFGVLAIGRDITDQKNKELELKKNLYFIQELIDILPNPIFYYDTSGKYIGCNKAYADIIGTAIENILDKNVIDFSFYKNSTIHGEMDKALFAGEKVKKYEASVTLSDNKEHDLVFSKTVFKQFDGSVGGIVGTIFDATEIKKLEIQLQQSQKMEAIGKLAGGVAHDFNNLLTVIIGSTELMLDKIGKNKELKERISEIQKAAHRAESLTKQLLAFSRKQILEPKILSINYLITDISKMLSRVIGEDIELELKLSSNIDFVEVDPGQIDQILMNLAVNARDAMAGGGKLTIVTENEYLDEQYSNVYPYVLAGPYVMLAISDTGIGMDDETQARIFEPFFTTKPKESGTGLGLSTVYGIVKQSNGYIWVFSEPGKGTTFKIYFPRVGKAPQNNHNAIQRTTMELHGSETILVVEDDESVRETAVAILERYGYDTIIAESGEDALTICRDSDKNIDLVITDVIMPGINGRLLIEALENLFSRIVKTLYMSGYTDNVIAKSGILDKDINFIQKPFKSDVLVRKVRKILDLQN